MPQPIISRRLTALYDYSNNSNSTQRKELLSLLLAMITHKQIKDVCDDLNITIPKE